MASELGPRLRKSAKQPSRQIARIIVFLYSGILALLPRPICTPCPLVPPREIPRDRGRSLSIEKKREKRKEIDYFESLNSSNVWKKIDSSYFYRDNYLYAQFSQFTRQSQTDRGEVEKAKIFLGKTFSRCKKKKKKRKKERRTRTRGGTWWQNFLLGSFACLPLINGNRDNVVCQSGWRAASADWR